MNDKNEILVAELVGTPRSLSNSLKVFLSITTCLGLLFIGFLVYAVYISNASQIGRLASSSAVPIIGKRIPEIGATGPIDYYVQPHQHGNVYGVLSGKIEKERLAQFMSEAGLHELVDIDNYKKQDHIDRLEQFRQDGRAFFPGQLTQDDYFFERPLEGMNEIYGVFRPEGGQFVLYMQFSDWHASLPGDDPLK